MPRCVGSWNRAITRRKNSVDSRYGGKAGIIGVLRVAWNIYEAVLAVYALEPRNRCISRFVADLKTHRATKAFGKVGRSNLNRGQASQRDDSVTFRLEKIPTCRNGTRYGWKKQRRRDESGIATKLHDRVRYSESRSRYAVISIDPSRNL